MSINNSFATDHKRLKKLGRFMPTIDVEIKEDLTAENVRNKKDYVVGTLLIGRSRFDLTLAELNYLAETCDAARESVLKGVKLGLLR